MFIFLVIFGWSLIVLGGLIELVIAVMTLVDKVSDGSIGALHSFTDWITMPIFKQDYIVNQMTSNVNVFGYLVPIIMIVVSLAAMGIAGFELSRISKSQRIALPYIKVMYVVIIILSLIFGRLEVLFLAAFAFVGLLFIESTLFDVAALRNFADERNSVVVYREDKRFERRVFQPGEYRENANTVVGMSLKPISNFVAKASENDYGKEVGKFSGTYKSQKRDCELAATFDDKVKLSADKVAVLERGNPNGELKSVLRNLETESKLYNEELTAIVQNTSKPISLNADRQDCLNIRQLSGVKVEPLQDDLPVDLKPSQTEDYIIEDGDRRTTSGAFLSKEKSPSVTIKSNDKEALLTNNEGIALKDLATRKVKERDVDFEHLDLSDIDKADAGAEDANHVKESQNAKGVGESMMQNGKENDATEFSTNKTNFDGFTQASEIDDFDFTAELTDLNSKKTDKGAISSSKNGAAVFGDFDFLVEDKTDDFNESIGSLPDPSNGKRNQKLMPLYNGIKSELLALQANVEKNINSASKKIVRQCSRDLKLYNKKVHLINKIAHKLYLTDDKYFKLMEMKDVKGTSAAGATEQFIVDATEPVKQQAAQSDSFSADAKSLANDEDDLFDLDLSIHKTAAADNDLDSIIADRIADSAVAVNPVTSNSTAMAPEPTVFAKSDVLSENVIAFDKEQVVDEKAIEITPEYFAADESENISDLEIVDESSAVELADETEETEDFVVPAYEPIESSTVIAKPVKSIDPTLFMDVQSAELPAASLDSENVEQVGEPELETVSPNDEMTFQTDDGVNQIDDAKPLEFLSNDNVEHNVELKSPDPARECECASSALNIQESAPEQPLQAPIDCEVHDAFHDAADKPFEHVNDTTDKPAFAEHEENEGLQSKTSLDEEIVFNQQESSMPMARDISWMAGNHITPDEDDSEDLSSLTAENDLNQQEVIFINKGADSAPGNVTWLEPESDLEDGDVSVYQNASEPIIAQMNHINGSVNSAMERTTFAEPVSVRAHAPLIPSLEVVSDEDDDSYLTNAMSDVQYSLHQDQFIGNHHVPSAEKERVFKETIENFEGKWEMRLDEWNGRINQFAQNIALLSNKLGNVDAKIDRFGQRFDGLSIRLEDLQKKSEQPERNDGLVEASTVLLSQQSTYQSYFNELKAELRSLNSHVDNVERNLTQISSLQNVQQRTNRDEAIGSYYPAIDQIDFQSPRYDLLNRNGYATAYGQPMAYNNDGRRVSYQVPMRSTTRTNTADENFAQATAVSYGHTNLHNIAKYTHLPVPMDVHCPICRRNKQ